MPFYSINIVFILVKNKILPSGLQRYVDVVHKTKLLSIFFLFFLLNSLIFNKKTLYFFYLAMQINSQKISKKYFFEKKQAQSIDNRNKSHTFAAAKKNNRYKKNSIYNFCSIISCIIVFSLSTIICK